MSYINKLTEDQLAELLERLTLHATWRFQKYGWLGNSPKFERAGPGGSSPQDIALGAILSVIDGTRNYDPELHPDFLKFLRSVVDSRINHLANSAELRLVRRMPTTLDNESEEPIEVNFSDNQSDPAQTCMAREVVNKAKAAVEVEAQKDPLVLQIFECLEAGIIKPSEMAEVLEVNVKEVNNAQKRLRRKLDRALANNQKERQR